MGGTAGPSPRAVAAGLAVALLVLLVVGRLQQHVLAPQPSAPARPLTVKPTATIPPIPVAARISVRVDDVIALASAAGEVWVLGPRELLRVDPDDNRVTARIRVPGQVALDGGGLAAGAGALWIRAGERTVRVDARRGRVTGSVPMPVQAAASDGLWSCTAGHQGGPDRLVRMDPRTLTVTARIRLPRCPSVLAAERGVVWALDHSGRQLLRVQAAGGRVTRIGLPVVTDSFLPDEAGFGGQLAIAEGAVWVVSDQIEMPTRLGGRVGRGVVRVDPRTARVTAVTPLDNLEPTWMALAVGAGGVWVGGPQAQRAGPAHGLMVDRIDPRSGRLAGTFALTGNTGGLLAAGHGSLWLATFGGGELLRLDPSRR
jgi:hypothetical protein